MRRISCFLFAVALAGCSDLATTSISEHRTFQHAVGEPVEGFPSWAERVAWVWTNRARQDPQAELADCDACADKACYTPKPPITWSPKLARAARFHSDNLVNNGLGIQHDSPCDLVPNIAEFYPDECNGEAACACEGGQLGCAGECPSFFQRLSLFDAPGGSENISTSGNPISAITAFTHEPYDVSECGRDYDSMGRPNGHRVGVLENGPSVGIGIGEGGRILTMDFGGGGVASEKIVSGVHTPEAGVQVEFRANWYDDATPTTAVVNVEGECTTMTVERGTPENGTYLVETSVPSGCARYRFEFTDAAGSVSLFPGTGSFGIGCPDEYMTDPPPECGCVPECGGRVCGDDGCGSTCGTCADTETCDAAGQCIAPGSNNASTNNATTTNNRAGNTQPDGNDSTVDGDDATEDTGPTDPDVKLIDDEGGVDASVEGKGKACAHAVAPTQGSTFWSLFALVTIFCWRRR